MLDLIWKNIECFSCLVPIPKEAKQLLNADLSHLLSVDKIISNLLAAKVARENNVIVTPCSVSSAIRQSPYTMDTSPITENLQDSRVSMNAWKNNGEWIK